MSAADGMLEGMSSRDASPTPWRTRTERPDDPDDTAALRELLVAAFPTSEEADLVEALRSDGGAWIEGLSWIAHAGEDPRPVAQALLTRAHVGGEPVLALAPCATLPARQGRGAGSAAIRAALGAARGLGENLVVVLGHAEFYPRFGFAPAPGRGAPAPYDGPDEAFPAPALPPARPTPRGEVAYPSAFGV
jgi:predicted N-acetyltransferase YhbS